MGDGACRGRTRPPRGETMTRKRSTPETITITFTVAEAHDALAAWLKKTRPKEYKAVKGKQSALFVTTRRGKLDTVGFEVDP